MIPYDKTALLVVDAQPTFMPGGELPVPDGDAIIAPLLAFIRAHGAQLRLIVFSRDWHPRDHCSFSETPRFVDGSWPAHGIAGTPSAQIHPALTALCDELKLTYTVISKGMDSEVEAYSAFDGFGLDSCFRPSMTDDCEMNPGPTLEEELRYRGVEGLLVAGLAGEVCVRATVLDALKASFTVALLTDAIGFLGDPDPTYRELCAPLSMAGGPGAFPLTTNSPLLGATGVAVAYQT